MNCIYRMMCALTVIDGCEAELYGIAVFDSGGNRFLSVPAVFVERSLAESCVESLNRNHLDPDQLFELLDDLL